MKLRSILSAAAFMIMFVPALGAAETSFGVCDYVQSRSVGGEKNYTHVEWDLDPDREINQAIITYSWGDEKNRKRHGKVVNVSDYGHGGQVNMRFPGEPYELEIAIWRQKSPQIFTIIYEVYFSNRDGERLVQGASSYDSKDDVKCVLR